MVAYKHISHGFDPVFDENSRILILGSFPSVLSRENAFYYGNPQNRFWRVIAHAFGEQVPPNKGDLLGNGEPATIEQSMRAKRELLLRHGLALWDVIQECDIKGSSDASIKNVVPAQVGSIMEESRIGSVVCNGGTAGRLYKRYLEWETGIAPHVLPSTSPANAAWSLERLQARWEEELRSLESALAEAQSVEDRSGNGQASSRDGRHSSHNDRRSSHDDQHPSRESSSRDGQRSSHESSSHVEYASVRLAAPKASNYAVHKSMQGNKRKDTKPELLVRERLREAGLGGYRLQWKAPGRPDVAWPGKKVCLFVNGCFWHRCPHCNPSTPAKNVEYWTEKFARNVERDEKNLRALADDGWKVHVVWECQLKKNKREETFNELLPQLARELGKQLIDKR